MGCNVLSMWNAMESKADRYVLRLFWIWLKVEMNWHERIFTMNRIERVRRCVRSSSEQALCQIMRINYLASTLVIIFQKVLHCPRFHKDTFTLNWPRTMQKRQKASVYTTG
jgi:hypothetical protein